MTSADLGTCFGAILFHPSTYSSSSASLWQRCQPRHFARHADLLRYIIDIWPQKSYVLTRVQAHLLTPFLIHFLAHFLPRFPAHSLLHSLTGLLTRFLPH